MPRQACLDAPGTLHHERISSGHFEDNQQSGKVESQYSQLRPEGPYKSSNIFSTVLRKGFILFWQTSKIISASISK